MRVNITAIYIKPHFTRLGKIVSFALRFLATNKVVIEDVIN